MASRRSSAKGSVASEARRLSRMSPEPVKFQGSFAHDMSHNNTWSGMPSLRFSGHETSYDVMAMDTFSMENNTFPLTMMSVMNNCYDSPTTYASMNHGPMSQTLSGPYHDSIMGEEMMRTDSLGMDYQQYSHLPAANFRHGLPSPPADITEPEDQDFSMSSTCDMAFTLLPGPVMNGHLSYEKIPSSRSVDHFNLMMIDTDAADSIQRPQQPRPIRSASERDLMNQATLAPQDTQYSRDERGDRVKARNDPRYDQGPDKNGFYHCPLVGDGSCNHKPTKQKCIYAKYLDSHLKPYVCKHGYGKDCENLRFSSNACLFRHEREAHGLHNHGLNPYLCMFPGCERARKDNGFPRRWNQRDHMKRVHDWIEVDESEVETLKYARTAEPARRRKGSGSVSTNGVSMKRSGSSHAKAQAATSGNGPRQRPAMSQYPGQVEEQFQHCDMMAQPMSVNDVHYTTISGYQQQSRTPSYPGGYVQLVC